MDTQTEIPLTEKKSKVKSVSFKKEWKGTYGQMFDFTIEFENADKGVYQTNNKDQDNFVVGQEVDYSIESKIKGRFNDVWIKFIPKNRSSGGRGRQFEKNYKCDHIREAALCTKDLFVAGKVPDKKVGDKTEKMKFAELFEYIYSVMDKKLNEVNGQKTNNETEEKK